MRGCQLRINLHVQVQPTCAGLRRQQPAHAFQQRPQRLRYRLQPQCVGLQPRVVKDVVKDLPEHLRRILDHAKDAFLLCIQR